MYKQTIDNEATYKINYTVCRMFKGAFCESFGVDFWWRALFMEANFGRSFFDGCTFWSRALLIGNMFEGGPF